MLQIIFPFFESEEVPLEAAIETLTENDKDVRLELWNYKSPMLILA